MRIVGPVAGTLTSPMVDMASDRSHIDHEAAAGTSPRQGAAPPQRRRVGLGRRLDEVIETHDAHARPAHLVATSPPDESIEVGLVLNVAVVETVDGVCVDVEGAEGTVVSVPVEGSLDDAVVRATVELLEVDPRWDVVVGGTSTRHGEVIVVTASDGRGATKAGAAPIEFARPWAIARAVASMVGA